MNFTLERLKYSLRADLEPYLIEPGFTSDQSIADARATALLQSFDKKFEPSSSKALDDNAIALFLTCNERCKHYRPTFVGYHLDAFNQMEDLLYKSVHRVDPLFPGSPAISWDLIVSRGLPGPGASNGRSNDNSFFMKMFDSDLTATHSALHDIYYYGIAGRWREAEETRRRQHGLRTVRGSKTSCVPKNNAISRTICTEPILNMFLQKGIGSVIEDWLRWDHSIDLSLQPEINAAMAQQGSVNGTYCTIDLSSASDTIALSLCNSILPTPLMHFLKATRSAFTEVNGEEIELHMISSMGNGFTFPLQTLIFASLVKAAYITMGLPLSVEGKPHYSVFGDDIIVCREAYDFVVQLLEGCGFTVNRLKSFSTGPFRESCGHDYFRGHNVRGVYLRRLNSHADFYSIINRLMRWSASSGIELKTTLRYLLDNVPFMPIPLHESDSHGIKVTSDFLKSPKFDHNGCWYYSAYTQVAAQKELGGSYVSHPGAITAFVGGYIRGNSYSVRNDRACFKVVKLRTPCWDYGLGAGVEPQELSNVLAAMI
nr:MAG: hypothetical protein 3 [Leviviridae sp.]